MRVLTSTVSRQLYAKLQKKSDRSEQNSICFRGLSCHSELVQMNVNNCKIKIAVALSKIAEIAIFNWFSLKDALS